MGLTATDTASLYYQMYSLSNNPAYQKYAVDSSCITKEDYNVSNLSNALDALNKTDTADFSSLTNISSYAKNSYQFSQLSDYSSLSSSSSFTNAKDLLTNNTDLTSLYKAAGSSSLLNLIPKSVWTAYAANATAQTTSDASEVGSIVDRLA